MKNQSATKASHRRRVFTISGVTVALVAVAVVSAGYWLPGRAENTREAAPNVKREAMLSVTTIKVEPTPITHSVAVDGAIFPWQEIIIAAEVGGYRVTKLNVDVGDEVKKGQELVTLSSSLLKADVASKKATVAQREAQLENAQASLARGRSLNGTAALSKADLDQLESAAKAATALVAAAKAELSSANLRLQLTHIRAPDSGVITSRSVTLGQVAQTGTELLRMLRQNRVEWRGEVPEGILSQLKPGLPVTVSVANGAKYEGKIRVVAPTVSTKTRTGLVYVDLPVNPDLRPGMFARGSIHIGRRRGLTAPLKSVVSADGYHYAFVLRPDQTVERRRITIGEVLGSRVEVTSGLKAGETIVDKGAGFLREGDLVNVVESGPAPAEGEALSIGVATAR